MRRVTNARRGASVAMIKAERNCTRRDGRVPVRRQHHGRVRQTRHGRAAVLPERMAADDFASIAGADVGIEPFGYVTSMVVTIALWLTLALAIGAAGRAPGKKQC